jgi:hypothetical protein
MEETMSELELLNELENFKVNDLSLTATVDMKKKFARI